MKKDVLKNATGHHAARSGSCCRYAFAALTRPLRAAAYVARRDLEPLARRAGGELGREVLKQRRPADAERSCDRSMRHTSAGRSRDSIALGLAWAVLWSWHVRILRSLI